MADNVQTWSIADGGMFLADPNKVIFAHELNDDQGARVFEAWGLWDDVSNLTAVWDYTDDDNLARDMTRVVDSHWAATLPGNWTRIAMGEVIKGDGTDHDAIGINLSKDLMDRNGNLTEPTRYHELYVDDRLDGADTFQLGSQSFSVLVHEIGHSVLDFLPDPAGGTGGHIAGAPTEAIMNASVSSSDGITREHYSDAWFAATPMPRDIDQAIAHYGPAWTRAGDDTYGFNAHFSGDYRAALDFGVNTRPLITIYDSDGNDTLDASGFTGRPVRVDLNPGGHSWMLDEPYQTFAVIYRGEQQTTWIENAVGGDGNDQLFGNERVNILSGNDGNDILDGRGGADIMMGGAGDDTYYVDDAGDQALDWPWDEGGLHDTVHTELEYFDLSNWQIASGIDDLVFDDDYLDLMILGREPTRHTGIGSDANNLIVGSRGIDTLIGNGGKDTLDGGAGDDYLSGGTDDDIYVVDSYGDVVDETEYVAGGGTGIARRNSGYRDAGSDNDTVITTLSSYDLSKVGSNNIARYIVPSTLYGTIENLTYAGADRFTGVGNDANNVITGGALSDSLYGGLGHDTVRGGAGNDGIDLGAGDDKAFIDNGTAEGGDVVVGGGGFDSVYADDSTIAGGLRLNVFRAGTDYTPDVNRVAFTSAAIDVDFIWGNAGSDVIDASRLDQRIDIAGMGGEDTIIGGAAGDNLYGGDEADTITGGAGADGMDGGNGSDTFVMDNGTELGGDVAVGGEGHDIVRADASVAATGLRLVLFPTGTGFTPDVNQVAYTSAAMDVEGVQGGTGNDWVDASRLSGNENLIFEGHEGMDRFVTGHAAFDIFDGGSDTDTAIFSGKASDYDVKHDAEKNFDVVVEKATGHFHVLKSVEMLSFSDGDLSIADALASTGKAMVGTEGNDTLIGTKGDDTIDALGGNDVIDGRGGTDTLNGSAGNDRFLIGGQVLEAGLDIIDGGADTDTIDFSGLDGSVNISLASGGFGMTAADGLSAAGGSPRLSNLENVVGSGYADTLEGDGGANVLIGGLGADTLTAGAGQDTLIVDNADTVDGGEGTDAVFADASTAAAGFRFNVAGTSVENVFAGNGNDVVDASGLSASSPVTQIWGNAGDDTLIGGGGIEWLDGGEGVDTAVFAGNLVDYTVTQQSTNGAVDWTGWTTITHIATGVTDWTIGVEKLQFADATIEAAPLPLQAATAGADVIAASDAGEVVYGLSGDDRLSGGTGSDTLVGGAGADALIGGAGTDLLYVDSADSLVDGGEGYDYVYADDSTGHTGLRLTVANTNVEFVYGNVGNDVIDASGLATGINIVGGWGDDVLTGGAEWDCIYGGDGNDTVLGNDGDDWLGGDGGDDVLTGGAGADTFFFGLDGLSGIVGAAGHDTITDFTAADGDRFDLTGYAGVKSLADLSLADNAEGNAVIGFGENTITLLEVSAASLDQSHFLFGA